jgi:hypothetical protein
MLCTVRSLKTHKRLEFNVCLGFSFGSASSKFTSFSLVFHTMVIQTEENISWITDGHIREELVHFVMDEWIVSGGVALLHAAHKTGLMCTTVYL